MGCVTRSLPAPQGIDSLRLDPLDRGVHGRRRLVTVFGRDEKEGGLVLRLEVDGEEVEQGADGHADDARLVFAA
jgi:hypothetical protein